MELSNHPGLSEADVEAAEVLDELRKTITNTRSQIGTIQQQKFNPTIIRSLGDCEDDSKPVTREGSINLLNRVVNNVVTFYDDRRKLPLLLDCWMMHMKIIIPHQKMKVTVI